MTHMALEWSLKAQVLLDGGSQAMREDAVPAQEPLLRPNVAPGDKI